MGVLALVEREGALEVVGEVGGLGNRGSQALVQGLGGLNACLVHCLGLQNVASESERNGLAEQDGKLDNNTSTKLSSPWGQP